MFYKFKNSNLSLSYFSKKVENVIINIDHIHFVYRSSIYYYIVFKNNTKATLRYDESKEDIQEIERLMGLVK
ncbi:hypothetical protein ELUMI_v1c01610 [Williamsoniiplasma luminosum]|uniref:Uncharacterized protein n=1 Tax=Williamsoniiplasma luminosum TaxID=214888 RepID=A0A2K8NTJ9_9MOLU|nr:hypothetical protein [Williamsoniiplasma luminosum]ATZ16886.1 hypothetical protein ELUMI_v1c01610 [Williamsoniiplasma luminosum]AVP49554.1 MAG: hypothetical protein C5T88_03180 [Williamsoniiplasma luminosum]